MTVETGLNKYSKPWVVKKSSFNYRTCIDDCDGDLIAQTVINNLSLKGAEDLTKHIVKCVNEYDKLRQAKAELIEALRFYADQKHTTKHQSLDYISTIYMDTDHGKVAQKALEKAKGDE